MTHPPFPSDGQPAPNASQPPPAQPHAPAGGPYVPGVSPYTAGTSPSVNPYVAGPPPGTAPAEPVTYPVHQAYADRRDGRPSGSPPPVPSPKKSAWNIYAYGLVGILLVVVAVLGSAQLKARKTESQVKPLVVALAHRDARARCPRYITAVLTDVGSVRLDSDGRIADRTDLTGPVCDGLRHLYAAGGTAELSCLTAGGDCPESALVSVVAISVVAHESMHLRGQLDEGRAECESIGESQALSSSLGIPLEQARMISFLHYAGMNPYTPDRYQVSASNCAPVADLLNQLPGDPAVLEALRVRTSDTWRKLAS